MEEKLSGEEVLRCQFSVLSGERRTRLLRTLSRKKRPRVGVGPPGERKEEVEVFVSSPFMDSKASAIGPHSGSHSQTEGYRFETPSVLTRIVSSRRKT
jgi:hypothetical protein